MEILIYKDEYGNEPYIKWMSSINDLQALAMIDVRLERIRGGNLGDCRSVGKGVFELRIHCGPGYRVYFGREGERIVILVLGGSKRSQSKDIRTARAIWKGYKNQK
jgi:putative addiction module killer protein